MRLGIPDFIAGLLDVIPTENETQITCERCMDRRIPVVNINTRRRPPGLTFVTVNLIVPFRDITSHEPRARKDGRAIGNQLCKELTAKVNFYVESNKPGNAPHANGDSVGATKLVLPPEPPVRRDNHHG